jgi:hypothetical protein
MTAFGTVAGIVVVAAVATVVLELRSARPERLTVADTGHDQARR